MSFVSTCRAFIIICWVLSRLVFDVAVSTLSASVDAVHCFSYGPTKLDQLAVSCCKCLIFSTFDEHIGYALAF